MSNRHSWSGPILFKNVDGGTIQCIKCGYIKQYVKGIPTFFRDDIVYDRFAPKCDNHLKV